MSPNRSTTNQPIRTSLTPSLATSFTPSLSTSLTTRLAAILACAVLLASCLPGSNPPTATPTAAATAIPPTRQATSSPTPSPSPTPAPSLTLIPTFTAAPELAVEVSQATPTPLPLPDIAIEASNAAEVGQLALWGRGAILHRHLAADGQVWVVLSSLGVYLYDSHTLELIAHIEDVQLDQISPDGQDLAVADSNQRISLYRLTDGQKLLTLDKPTFKPPADRPVETIAPEASTGGETGDTVPAQAGPQIPATFYEFLDPDQLPGVTALHFSTAGDRLAVGYNQPAIIVWDLHTGQIVSRLQHAIMPAANRIEFSPDGAYLANNTYANVLGLWSLAEERLIWRTANGGRLTPVSFLPDGARLLTESTSSERVFIWDMKSGSLEQTVQVTNLVDYLNFSQDGNSLFFLTLRPQSRRYLIEQRSVRDGKLETFAEFPANYAIAPDRLSLAGMDEASQLQHFNLRTWQLTTDLLDAGDPSRRLEFSFSGSSLAAVGWQSITRWDYPDLQLIAQDSFEQPLFNLHLSKLQGLQLLRNQSAGQGLLAYGQDGGHLFVWHVTDGGIDRLDLPVAASAPPALAPDGRYLAICTSEGLRLFDLVNTRSQLLDRCKSPGLLLFLQDRTQLARASGLQIDLLSLPGGARSQYLAGNTLEITSLAFSPDGSHFASGTSPELGGAEAVIWDLGRPLFPMRLPVPSFGVELLAFTSDNQFLVTGGGDNKLRLWRVSDGWLLRVATLQGSASRLAISPNDQLVVAGLSDGSIQMMTIPDGETLAVLSGHRGRITGLAFSRDGTSLYSSSADGTVRLWGLPLPSANQ